MERTTIAENSRRATIAREAADVRREHHLAVQRTARYYTLGALPTDALGADVTEVWMVCHGYGQLAAPFLDAFARIADPARCIVAPEALSRFYLDRSSTATDPPPRVGATWMTREDREHEIADQVAYLDALHDRCRPSSVTDRVRLRVLGFSQGVATASRWLAYGRVRADELIAWAGAFPPEVDLGSFADRMSSTTVALVVGTRDGLASWAAADAQLERFTAAGIRARLVSFDGGHRLDGTTLVALAGSSG
jgi:predicted esterase